ncbi:hypothetical protein MIPYR_10138 [uncultured Microbacterium sp.]|uniref:Uncharacterized protein n=1 Tax=uncultured Microbacterium sp. TaxID=191216 RepID=A0A1Y5NU74_9MICO|nr:hypothetical protein MIPYR_10138 [uncultured Microbacterium sp.]
MSSARPQPCWLPHESRSPIRTLGARSGAVKGGRERTDYPRKEPRTSRGVGWCGASCMRFANQIDGRRLSYPQTVGIRPLESRAVPTIDPITATMERTARTITRIMICLPTAASR